MLSSENSEFSRRILRIDCANDQTNSATHLTIPLVWVYSKESCISTILDLYPRNSADLVQYYDSKQPTLTQANQSTDHGDEDAMYIEKPMIPLYFPLGARYELPPEPEFVPSSDRRFMFNLVVSEATAYSRKAWRRLAQLEWCQAAQQRFKKECFVHSVRQWHMNPAAPTKLSLEEQNVMVGTSPNAVSTADFATVVGQSMFTLSPKGHNVECFRVWEAAEHGSIPVVDVSEDVTTYINQNGTGKGRRRQRQEHQCWRSLAPFYDTSAPFLFVKSKADAWKQMAELVAQPHILDARAAAVRAWHTQTMRTFSMQLEDLLDAKMKMQARVDAQSLRVPLEQVVQLGFRGSHNAVLHRFLKTVYAWSFKYLGSPIQTSCLGRMHHHNTNLSLCDFMAADQGRSLPILRSLTNLGCRAINYIGGCTMTAAVAAAVIGSSAAGLSLWDTNQKAHDPSKRVPRLTFPQLTHLDKLTRENHKAKFVLLTRDPEAWAREHVGPTTTGSAEPGGDFESVGGDQDDRADPLKLARLARGPPMDVAGRAAWYERANQAITSYFEAQASSSSSSTSESVPMFIKHDLEKDDPRKLLSFLNLPGGFATKLKQILKKEMLRSSED